MLHLIHDYCQWGAISFFKYYKVLLEISSIPELDFGFNLMAERIFWIAQRSGCGLHDPTFIKSISNIKLTEYAYKIEQVKDNIVVNISTSFVREQTKY